jgi:hypothetical protein
LEEIETQPDAKGLESAFQTAKQKQVNAIMTTVGPPFFAERKRIVELAGKYRLPAIYPQKEFVDEGGLMSYGADYDDLFRRAAVYVDKILKGAKPADLPVQPKEVPRIGYLSNNDPARESTRSEAIRLALRERGHIEGQNIATEYRYAEGKFDQVPELAAALVHLKVDIKERPRGCILRYSLNESVQKPIYTREIVGDSWSRIRPRIADDHTPDCWARLACHYRHRL